MQTCLDKMGRRSFHFGDFRGLDYSAGTDQTSTQVKMLHNQKHANQTTAILDFDAAMRALTASKVAASNARTAWTKARRGQIVNRSALGKEIDTDTAALLELVSDMDDLVIQFEGTDLSRRFQEAWKRARTARNGRAHGAIEDGNSMQRWLLR